MNAPGSPAMNQTIDHDEAGRPVVEVSPLGFEQTRAFDGPLLAFSGWDDSSGHAGRQTMSYDDDGQVTAILVGTPGSERVRTELSYDVTGELTTVKRIALDGSAATTISCQDMGPGGRLRETVSGEGVRVRYTRDGEGRVLSIQRGDLGPSFRAWDDACLPHPTGGTQAFTLATFVYDTSGRMISSTDERGRITTVTYDGLGRPVIENSSDGMQARRGYDALGNVTWEALYTTASAPLYRPPSWGDGGLQSATDYVYDSRGRISEVRRWHFEGRPGRRSATATRPRDSRTTTSSTRSPAPTTPATCGSPATTAPADPSRRRRPTAPPARTRTRICRTVRITEPGARRHDHARARAHRLGRRRERGRAHRQHELLAGQLAVRRVAAADLDHRLDRRDRCR